MTCHQSQESARLAPAMCPRSQANGVGVSLVRTGEPGLCIVFSRPDREAVISGSAGAAKSGAVSAACGHAAEPCLLACRGHGDTQEMFEGGQVAARRRSPRCPATERG